MCAGLWFSSDCNQFESLSQNVSLFSVDTSKSLFSLLTVGKKHVLVGFFLFDFSCVIVFFYSSSFRRSQIFSFIVRPNFQLANTLKHQRPVVQIDQWNLDGQDVIDFDAKWKNENIFNKRERTVKLAAKNESVIHLSGFDQSMQMFCNKFDIDGGWRWFYENIPCNENHIELKWTGPRRQRVNNCDVTLITTNLMDCKRCLILNENEARFSLSHLNNFGSMNISNERDYSMSEREEKKGEWNALTIWNKHQLCRFASRTERCLHVKCVTLLSFLGWNYSFYENIIPIYWLILQLPHELCPPQHYINNKLPLCCIRIQCFGLRSIEIEIHEMRFVS